MSVRWGTLLLLVIAGCARIDAAKFEDVTLAAQFLQKELDRRDDDAASASAPIFFQSDKTALEQAVEQLTSLVSTEEEEMIYRRFLNASTRLTLAEMERKSGNFDRAFDLVETAREDLRKAFHALK
ncbi:hypothetical protein Pan216_27090 [Planctomycetes bacterium Pan216]|uniref:Uncharacterized protein n=1 Tax=Kolteria novifilia TaxID=2527975 RepID=A0A518B4G2_9BACT|nr:hypothetical protein Pan216_27090 [Planctomycetes bacterium Pan216]